LSETGPENNQTAPNKPDSKSRRSFLKKAVAVGAGAAAVAAGIGALYDLEQQSKPSGPPFGSNQIKHWIMIMQENRTFSMYFTNYPGANSSNPSGVATTNQADGGANHMETAASHSWNNGAMNPDDFLTNEGDNTLHYYPRTVTGVSDYWTLAGEFTLFDNFFGSWMGYSLPSHLINISANLGYDNPPVSPVDPNLMSIDSTQYPTMPDRLNAAGISWRYYGTYTQTTDVPDLNYWCVLQYWANYNLYYKNNCVPNTNILTDVTLPESEFPTVAWVCAPPGLYSEHPPNGPEDGYQNWTGPIISKIMANTDLWNSCAILLVWDDYGGYYDHVPPPGVTPAPISPPSEQVDVSGTPNTYYYGFRVPALMISPFAKKGYIDSTQYDFTSFLKTLEVQYSLPSLNGLDTVANDFLTHTPFDFTQAPRSVQGLKSFHPELAAKPAPRWLAPNEYKHVGIPMGEEIEGD
jgi:phospholipase C